MWSVSRKALKAFEHRRVDPPCAKLVDKFIIVNRKLLSIGRYGAFNVPWSYDLVVCLSFFGWFYRRLSCRCSIDKIEPMSITSTRDSTHTGWVAGEIDCVFSTRESAACICY